MGFILEYMCAMTLSSLGQDLLCSAFDFNNWVTWVFSEKNIC